MNAKKIAAAGVVAIVLLTLVFFEMRQRRVAEGELALVKAQLTTPNDRIREAEERAAKTRHDNALCTVSTPPTVQLQATNDNSTTRVETTTSPLRRAKVEADSSSRLVAISNVGNASAGDAIYTAQWAMVEGRPDVLVKCIELDSESRKAAEALLNKLSEEQRARYPTPEDLVAVLMCRDDGLKVISRVAVLSQERTDDDHTIVRINAEDPTGKILEGNFEVHRTPAGWQWSIPSDMIKRSLTPLPEVPKR